MLSNWIKVLSNPKKLPSNRKKVPSKRNKVIEQSEKVTEQSEITSRAIRKSYLAIRKGNSNQIRLQEQSGKGTEQLETIANAVVVRLVEKRGQLRSNKVFRDSRVHRHDCWAYGARVLMSIFRSRLKHFNVSFVVSVTHNLSLERRKYSFATHS